MSTQFSQIQKKAVELAAPIGLVILFVALWEIILPFTNVSKLVLPLPSEIGKSISDKLPVLLKHSRVTTLESVYGFLLSVALGIPIAFGIFSSKIFALGRAPPSEDPGAIKIANHLLISLPRVSD